jgi:GT2 family glycosyltransferase/glycosyltransferase involved in cell wall biosynthesis
MSMKTEHETSVLGMLDDVAEGFARGWAFDRTKPTARLPVEIWEGDRLITVGEASDLRGDLRDAGIGDGCHGFTIKIPILSAGAHRIHAKISGSPRVLGDVVAVNVPDIAFRGRLHHVEGLAIKGSVSVSSHGEAIFQLIADNAFLDEIRLTDIRPNTPSEFSFQLPLSLADGRVHWFQLTSRETGKIIAEAVSIIPMILTPEQSLQRYTNDFPAYLSASAANRYVSLERSLHLLASTAPSDVADAVRHLEIAHRQVKRGIAGSSRPAETLHFKTHERPLVSVVIPAHNHFTITFNCLAALLLAPNDAPFEVIVVDDGSTDLTGSLDEFVTGITLLRNEDCRGFVDSSNRGASVARGEFVVMLNNDTEPCAGWIDELLYVFEHFDKVGLAGAKLIYPDGKLQEAGCIVLPNFDVMNYGRGENQFDTKYNYTRQVDYVSGACIMLRRDLWNELGGFDPIFAPAYYEDNDLAFRVRAAGLKTFYAPLAKIIHFEGQTSGTSVQSGAKKYQIVNEPKYKLRWASTIRRLPMTLDLDVAKDRNVLWRVLFIDVQAPQPDKDAGSYAARQEMRLFQALGFKVTFAPDNMAYLGNYTEALQRDGVECLYAPFQLSVHDIIDQRGPEFDVIYITRYSVAERYIDRIRSKAPRAKIIFNDADLHFLREIRTAIAAKSQEALRDALKTRAAELEVMRRVDITLTYTSAEAAVILSHNADESKVAKCPWVADVDQMIPPFSSRKGLGFLGNFSHPPNLEAISYFAKEVLPSLLLEIPDLTLSIFGSFIPKQLYELESANLRVEGHAESVADVYHTCRIFIAPLVSGAGIKGKVIGALAAGTPTVMSSVAAEGIEISNGIEAIVARDPQEWVDAIKRLYRDENAWLEMSANAQRFVRTNFSFETGVKQMRQALALAGLYVD